MKKPEFKHGDKVYFVAGARHSYSIIPGILEGCFKPGAINIVEANTLLRFNRVKSSRIFKTRKQAKTYIAARCVADSKRTIGIAATRLRHVAKTHPQLVTPIWLDDIRTAVNDGPIGSTTMVGHKQLSDALAFIEKTLGLAPRKVKPLPEERYS